MNEMLTQLALAAMTIFFALDPIGLVPIYAGLTEGMDAQARRRVARLSVITASAVAIGFIFLGKWIFIMLGITSADFMVAGGGLLFIFAVADLVRGTRYPKGSEHIGAVPLGTPLIVGPGVLTASLIQVDLYGYQVALAAVILNIILVWIALTGAGLLMRLLGQAGAKAASKVANLLLAAIAVMMVRKGVLMMIAMALPMSATTCTPVNMPAAQNHPATQAGKYRDVELFGKTLGTPMNNGFVFIDGKYIESPYTVSRIGADLYINDILAVKGRWPQPQYDVSKDAVGIPPGLTEDMDFSEMEEVLGEHKWQKLRYLSAHPSDKPFAERYAEYYRQMPCVDRVTVVETGDSIYLLMKNGEYFGMGIGPLELGHPEYNSTQEQVLNKLEYYRGRIEYSLKVDMCVFFAEGEYESYNDLKAEDAARKLPLFLEIVHSNRDIKDKHDLILRLGLFNIYNYVFDEIGRGLPADKILENIGGNSKVLEKRIKALADKLDVKPLTVDELPIKESLFKGDEKIKEERHKRKAAYWAKMATHPATAPAGKSGQR
ncbi:MAG: MarC family protein [Planctomycetes bacterium]|nr:MarC family protein [Planctomycetota bacterium]